MSGVTLLRKYSGNLSQFKLKPWCPRFHAQCKSAKYWLDQADVSDDNSLILMTTALKSVVVVARCSWKLISLMFASVSHFSAV